jgi:hypothetical protein
MKAPWVLLTFMLVVSTAIVSCSKTDAVRGNVVQRQDGERASALVTEDGSGGGTVPWVLRVYVGSTGAQVEALKAIHARDLTVNWTGAQQLTISMACGEILGFTNVVDAYSADRKGFERIEIQLDVNGLCPESWPPS